MSSCKFESNVLLKFIIGVEETLVITESTGDDIDIVLKEPRFRDENY